MLHGDGMLIKVGYKFRTQQRLISQLSWNQQAALQSHLRNLAAGRETMERFNFIEGETMFSRGQPNTEFTSLDPRNNNVHVYLTGLGHWQVFKNGSQTKGTRYTENLQSTLLKVIQWDDEQLVL